MVLRFESHVHTNFSDGNFYKFIIRVALKKRIDVIAITDHNSFKGYEFCVRYAKDCSRRNKGEIFILPAEEIGCKEGDVLAYGISEEIKKGRVAETIDIIHDQGGLAVMAHPFNVSTSVSTGTAKKNAFDGIEVVNYTNIGFFQRLAQNFAKAMPHLFQIGGGDSHQPWDLGLVLNLIDAEPETDSVLNALTKKKIRIVQSPEAFPWRARKTIRDAFLHGLTYLRCGLKYQMRWLWKKELKKRQKSDQKP